VQGILPTPHEGRRPSLLQAGLSHDFGKTIHKLRGTPLREGRYPHGSQSEFAQSDSGLLAEVNGVMDSIIYLVGLIVVVMFILSALGLH